MTKATEIREVLEMVTEGPVVREVPEGAKRAKRCQCPEPVTYRDEDGDLRCTCGRAV